MISAVYRQSDFGPKRKYYFLTEKGRGELRDFTENYRELSNAVEHLFADIMEEKP